MDIIAKIRPEYLDELLAGTKKFELRQFDSIRLKEIGGRRRVVVFGIRGVIKEVPDHCLNSAISPYGDDIPWRPFDKFPVYSIPIGKITLAFEGVECHQCKEFTQGWCNRKGQHIPLHRRAYDCIDFNP